jgi:hypothetical protein
VNTPGADGPPSDADDFNNGDLSDLGIVIPDDLRDLDDEVRAYRRELRGARRRALLRHPLSGRRHAPPTPVRGRGARPSIPVLIIALLLPLAMVMAMILIVLPQSLRSQPHSLPLANVRTPAGALGGTLPAGDVIMSDHPVALRYLRPAALVLVPASCSGSSSCDDLLSGVADEAAFHGVPLYLVAESGTQAQLDDLMRVSGEFPTVVAIGVDPENLLSVYRPAGLTVVPVHADGVVNVVDRAMTGQVDLDSQFAVLWQAGAST